MTDEATTGQTQDIVCERRGAAGFVVLNRPKALNALNHPMVKGLAAALDAWEHDPAVTRIVVTGAGDRAFCAGGDIRLVTEQCKAGRADEALAFWADEYRLNVRIKRYPKPYVSLIDGIVMGGGVGVSLHGSHVVGTQKYLFAMPEVGIGFFPDVGGSYALPRLPGRTGTWLALTGERIGLADAAGLGLVTHCVASDDLPALRDALCEGVPVDEALAARRLDPGPSPALADRPVIDRCFDGGTVPDIMAALERAAPDSPLAERALAAMRAKSPTSQAIALEQMRRGAAMDFESAMAMEMRIVSRIVEGHDFFEGVRAVIVDKDQKPVWRPDRIDAVDAAAIARYFEPLPPHRELFAAAGG